METGEGCGMKLLKKISVWICAVSILFLPVYAGRAYSYIDLPEFGREDKCSLLAGMDNGCCLIGASGQAARAQYIKEDGTSYSTALTLENECISFTASGGRVYFSARLTAQDSQGTVRQTSVTSYDFSTGQTDILFLNGVSPARGSRFSVGGGKFYFVDDRQKDLLKVFSESGTPLFTVSCPANILQTLYDRELQTLFVLTSDALYYMGSQDRALKKCMGGVPGDTLHLAGGGLMTDKAGNVYRFNGSSARRLFSAKKFTQMPNGAVTGGILYVAEDGKIDGYQISSGKRVRSLRLNHKLDFLCPSSGMLGGYDAGSGRFYLFSANEIPEIPEEKPTQPSGGDSSSSSSAPVYGKITSSVYHIDRDRFLISGISGGTTVAKFKSNLSYGDYRVSFKNYKGADKTSGNAGTGTTAYFSDANGNRKEAYILIVAGDLTGEGNVNANDKRAAMSELLGESKLTFPFDLACDMNGDGMIDTLDLLKIAKQ